MAFSQLLQWTILIIILALLQHMIHFMELGSLFQHPDKDNLGTVQVFDHRPACSTQSRKLACLPESYVNIPVVTPARQDPPIPKIDGTNKADCHHMSQALKEEYG